MIKNGQASAWRKNHSYAFRPLLVSSEEEKAWQVILFPGRRHGPFAFRQWDFARLLQATKQATLLLQQLEKQPKTQQLLQNSLNVAGEILCSHVRCYGISIYAHPDSKNRRGFLLAQYRVFYQVEVLDLFSIFVWPMTPFFNSYYGRQVCKNECKLPWKRCFEKKILCWEKQAKQ